MATVTIRLKRNGPYLIAAEQVDQIEIIDADGQRLVPEPGRIVLCRCGGSATKPFCDGTHRRNGFIGSSPAPEPSMPPEKTASE
ncbi:MAG TPA: CDGSH iron-sulfur domain-containing protein [Gemmatimonadaceae bacterium]